MGLLQMSITAGVLVVGIVLIRAIALNKLPKTAFLMLWGVVLFRLLVPFAIPVQFSVYNAVRGIISTVSPYVPHVPETGAGIGGGLGEMPIWVIPPPPIDGTATWVTPPAPDTTPTQIFPTHAMIIVWLVGVAAFLVFFAILYFKTHRRLRFATQIRDNAFLNEWLAENRLMRPISIMQSDRIITPLAVGLFKPRIILPLCMNLNDRELLTHVLTHEYFHIKRFDALWKMLLVVAVSVHWFNPLAWVMFILASRDMELTCDEMVIRHFGTETKAAYAYAIIGMAEMRSGYALLYNGFSKNAAKERIDSIMKIKKRSVVSIVTAFALIAVVTIGAFVVYAQSNGAYRDFDFDDHTPELYVEATRPDAYELPAALSPFVVRAEVMLEEEIVTVLFDIRDNLFALYNSDGTLGFSRYLDSVNDFWSFVDTVGGNIVSIVNDELLYEQHSPRHFTGTGAMQRALEVDGLIGVRGIGLNEGWAYARELHLFWDFPINNPDDALAYSQMLEDYAREHGNIRYVNVYDFYGTVIDQFRMEVTGNVLAPDSDRTPNPQGAWTTLLGGEVSIPAQMPIGGIDLGNLENAIVIPRGTPDAERREIMARYPDAIFVSYAEDLDINDYVEGGWGIDWIDSPNETESGSIY